jgi:hypothetical protein
MSFYLPKRAEGYNRPIRKLWYYSGQIYSEKAHSEYFGRPNARLANLT